MVSCPSGSLRSGSFSLAGFSRFPVFSRLISAASALASSISGSSSGEPPLASCSKNFSSDRSILNGFIFQFFEIQKHKESGHRDEYQAIDQVAVVDYKIVESAVQQGREEYPEPQPGIPAETADAQGPIVADQTCGERMKQGGAHEAHRNRFQGESQHGRLARSGGDRRP